MRFLNFASERPNCSARAQLGFVLVLAATDSKGVAFAAGDTTSDWPWALLAAAAAATAVVLVVVYALRLKARLAAEIARHRATQEELKKFQRAVEQSAELKITERKSAEEQMQVRREELASAARVSLVGEMASRLAHEINQPLTAIVNYAQGCVRRIHGGESDSQRLLSPLEQIVMQAERAARTIQHMRNLIARPRPRRTVSDINALVSQAAALAAPQARKCGVSVGLDLSDDLPPVLIDGIQIEQVILNLLHNGTEALANADGKRALSLKTSLCDEGIEVAISDTGPGLPPPLVDNPFEPFVTTKPYGIGLGLSISRGIIENYGGRLWVTQNQDAGVTFRFTLPLEQQSHEG